MTKAANLAALAQGPAFFAYRATSNQSVTSNVATKVQLNAELFDTDGAFDSGTNYRFQPSVAGYYQVSGAVYMNSGATSTGMVSYIYKNGSSYARSGGSISAGSAGLSVSTTVYLNGSTDYVELYGLNIASASPFFQLGSDLTYFTAALIRAA